MTTEDAQVILIAGFGALTQEVLHWYNLRMQLSNKSYRKTLRSTAYWVAVFAMAVFSGVFTWTWYYGEIRSPGEYLLTGVAFPLIVKKVAAALAANTTVQLGDNDGSFLTNYLLIHSPNVATKEAHDND